MTRPPFQSGHPDQLGGEAQHLRDRTGAVQLTHEKASDGEIAERIAALTPGSAISANG
jgi:hypothetical protein